MKKIVRKLIKSRVYEMLENFIFLFFQVVSSPFDFILTLFFKVTIIKPKNFKVPRGVLIISNHQSKIDPFLVIYNLGFFNLLRTLPSRFPVTHSYMKKWFVGTLIYFIGGFDIGNDSAHRMKKLLFIKSLLKKKRMVLIFPEAKIIKESSIDFSEFKKGVFFLLKEKNTPVLFIKIEGLNQAGQKNSRKIKYSDVLISDDVDMKIEKMQDFFTA
jgi:1-acyl-sn-glycerol-3-phosphate acyltransferase